VLRNVTAANGTVSETAVTVFVLVPARADDERDGGYRESVLIAPPNPPVLFGSEVDEILANPETLSQLAVVFSPQTNNSANSDTNVTTRPAFDFTISSKIGEQARDPIVTAVTTPKPGVSGGGSGGSSWKDDYGGLTIWGVIILPVVLFALLTCCVGAIAFRRGRQSGKLLTFFDKQPAFGWSGAQAGNAGGAFAFGGGGWARPRPAYTDDVWGAGSPGMYDQAPYFDQTPAPGFVDPNFSGAEYDLDFDGGTSLDRLKVMYEGDERMLGQDFQNPLHEADYSFSPEPGPGFPDPGEVWETAVDPSSGRAYRFNASTGERQWEI
jgi:hypothetical protein